MEFDPDKYLQEKQEFDPDAYLEKRSAIESDSPLFSKRSAKDAAMGLGQGATLGFGDEALAALQASNEAISALRSGREVPQFSDLAKKYRQYQKENEAAYEEAKARSPGLTFVGEVGGGLIPAVLTAGVSEVPTLTRAAISGAKIGALAGLGGSKGTTEEAISDIKQGKIPEMAKDVGMSAGIGAVAPAAFNAASGAKNLLSDLVENWKVPRQVLASFKEGVEGRSFIGDAATERLDKQAQEAATGFKKMIESGREFINNEYGKVLKNDITFTDKEKKSYNLVSEFLKKETGALEALTEGEARTEVQRTLNTLSKIKNATTVNAQDVKDAQKYLRELASDDKLTPFASEIYQNASLELDNALRNKIQSYNVVNQKYKGLEDAVESFATGVPTGSRSAVKRTQKQDSPLYKGAKAAYEKSQLLFGQGKTEFEKINLLKEELDRLVKKDPNILYNMGIKSPDDLIKNIRTEADIQAVANTIENAGALQQNVLGTLGTATIGTTYFGANLVGMPIGATGRALNLPQISRKLYQANDDFLYGVANRLNNSGYSHLGNALNDAIKNKSLTTKNAVLFSIMQNPKIRRDLFGDQGNKNE